MPLEDNDIIPEEHTFRQGADIAKARKGLVACSPYFITRWMPLLGGPGTMIVLALRSLGFYNPKTGELRNQITISREQLASMCGLSSDTLGRELVGDKKRPANPHLALFVRFTKKHHRDRLGRVRQEEGAYQIAMTDPVHPDDEAALNEYLEAQKKAKTPEPQNAVYGDEPEPQNAPPRPHFAAPTPQNAAHLIGLTLDDPSILKETPPGRFTPPPDRERANMKPSLSIPDSERAKAILQNASRALEIYKILRVAWTGGEGRGGRKLRDALGLVLLDWQRDEERFMGALERFFSSRDKYVIDGFDPRMFYDDPERWDDEAADDNDPFSSNCPSSPKAIAENSDERLARVYTPEEIEELDAPFREAGY